MRNAPLPFNRKVGHGLFFDGEESLIECGREWELPLVFSKEDNDIVFSIHVTGQFFDNSIAKGLMFDCHARCNATDIHLFRLFLGNRCNRLRRNIGGLIGRGEGSGAALMDRHMTKSTMNRANRL